MTQVATPSDFALLGLPDTATLGEVKAARRRLARHYHPDQAVNDTTAAAHMAQVNAAYDRIRSMHEARDGVHGAPANNVLQWDAGDKFMNRMKSLAIQAMINGGFLDDIDNLQPEGLPGVHFAQSMRISGGKVHVHLDTAPAQGRNVIYFPKPSFPHGDLSHVVVTTTRIESVEIEVERSHCLSIGNYILKDGTPVRVLVDFDRNGGTYNEGLCKALKLFASQEDGRWRTAHEHLQRKTAEEKQVPRSKTGLLQRIKRALSFA